MNDIIIGGLLLLFIGLVVLDNYAFKQAYQAGRQSVLDELHAKTDSLILQTDSLLFPDNPRYEHDMEEMLRRKAK